METSNDTGSGLVEKRVLASKAASDSAPMAAHLKRSLKPTPSKDKDELSDDDVLAILENALSRAGKKFGEKVGLSVPPNDSGKVALILPASIRYCIGCRHLRPKRRMIDAGKCEICDKANDLTK